MRRRDKEPPLEEQVQEVERRLEIYAALQTALSEPHDLLQILLDSPDPDAAVAALQSRFGFSAVAAGAVLDMQLHRVTAHERGGIADRHDEMVGVLEALRRRVAGSKE